jgi:transcriptional regulator with XRE-family HTH domain
MIMHKHAMKKTLAQVLLSMTIGRSGMTESQLAKVLGVTQPTVSRLKNGKISKISDYQRRLDEYLGKESKGRPDDFSELMTLAQSSSALREALIALQRFIQENA